MIFIRPGETKDEAMKIYRKHRQINPGDKVFVMGNMPIPEWYEKYV